MYGAELKPATRYGHEVHVGGVEGLPSGYFVFASRWVRAGRRQRGYRTLIDVLPDTGVGL